MKKQLFLSLFYALLVSPKLMNAATFTVTNTSDNPVVGTLRQAINNANATPGPDVIDFNITGAAPFIITINSSLPDITETVTIDGYSQPGTAPASGLTPAVLSIVVVGSSIPSPRTYNAFRINANDCIIKGLTINCCSNGIAILGTSSGNIISGNHIGLAYDGVTWVFNTHACGNGISLAGGSNNTIGGVTDADRNILTGNTFGISMGNFGPGNRVIGNFIGVDAVCSSNSSLYNATGITMVASSTPITIGGSTPGTANVISGNYNAGISINSADSVIIIGNYIGTDNTGLLARPNAISNLFGAVQIFSGRFNRVGGTSPGERNIISGNSVGYGGVYLVGESDSNYVMGNYIGLAADGLTALGNSYGVYIDGGATSSVNGNWVGNSDGSGANTIAYNTNDAVYIFRSLNTQNRVRRNKIYCNGAGVTLANGGNGFKPKPIIQKASIYAIAGTASAGDTIELYYADTTICATEQGITYFDYAVANSSGFWELQTSIPLWSRFVAIGTSTTGNSSIFSLTFQVTPCAVTAELAGPDLSTCVNTSKALGAVVTTTVNQHNYWIPEAGLSLLSSTSDPAALVESSAIGSYKMVWMTEDTISLCKNSDTAYVNVSILSAPSSAGADISVCVNASKQMAAVATSTIHQINYWDPEYNLSLQSAPNNPSALVQSSYPGTYRIVWFTEDTITSCVGSDTAFVDVITMSALSGGADLSVCLDDSGTLNATTNAVNPSLSYNWNNPSSLTLGSATSPSTSVSGNSAGSYILVWVTTDNSSMCVAGDTVYVTLTDCSEPPVAANAPLNVFPGVSPNNDKLNDTFIIENIEVYTDNTLVIYDREGNEIFSTNGYKNDWAATNQDGKQISSGTYFFKLVYNDADNKEKRISGYIEVRR